MTGLQTIDPLERFLEPSALIDFEHPALQGYIAAYHPAGRTDVEIVLSTFEFVRDAVVHSWDSQSRIVTAKASDVLLHRTGICYAKSHLFAALLRGMQIPAGICYQKLTLLDTPDSGYCIHALNTVYVPSIQRWIRLDARGNKPGVDAQFSLTAERLAFPVRAEYGEIDYRFNHAEPHPAIVSTLQAHTDCVDMCLHHLPSDL